MKHFFAGFVFLNGKLVVWDVPSEKPSNVPSRFPSSGPSGKPSKSPTSSPTKIPTDSPTLKPSSSLSEKPTKLPTSKTCFDSRKNSSATNKNCFLKSFFLFFKSGNFLNRTIFSKIIVGHTCAAFEIRWYVKVRNHTQLCVRN